MGERPRNSLIANGASGESLVRRLLYGEKLRARHEALEIGQLPQILRLFGHKKLEVSGPGPRRGFNWEGDDGSIIQAQRKPGKQSRHPSAQPRSAAEGILHDLEFLATIGWRLLGLDYPDDGIKTLWKRLLAGNEDGIAQAIAPALAATLDPLGAMGVELETSAAPVNTIGFDRREVAQGPQGELVFVDVPAYGVGIVREHPTGVAARQKAGRYLLENEHLRAEFDPSGALMSLYEKDSERETLAAPGNQVLLAGKAWKGSSAAIRSHPLRGELEITYESSRKGLVQTIRLDAASRWLEFSHQARGNWDFGGTQVEFPLLVHNRWSTCAAAFGSAPRSTDQGEIAPTFGWLDFSEYRFGVAVVGPEELQAGIQRNLLRVQASEPFALVPHLGDWRDAEVVGEARKFARPILWGKQWAEPGFYVRCDDPNLVIETVKRSESGRGVVVRLVEYHGGRGVAHIHSGLMQKRAWFCDGQEKKTAPADVIDGAIMVPYGPHQIVGLWLG